MDDLFREAVRAIGRGDALRLKDLLSGNPGLVHARGEPETGYFSRATLLHHTAGNPSRCPIPPNVVEIMELLLNAGVPVDAETDFGDWSWTALGLVASGRQPCESGLWGQMIDCLLQAGADINVRNGIVMYGALFHTQECQGQRTVAEELYRKGAAVDFGFASGLGALERVRSYFAADGTLLPGAYSLYRPERHRLAEPDDRRIINEALSWASINNRTGVADYLLDKGADINCTTDFAFGGATPLHRAALAGWEEMVKFLLHWGADPHIRDSTHSGTPAEWAEHAGWRGLAEFIRTYDDA